MTSAVAVVFPGQGAQVPGMGLELARAYPHTAGRVFEVADRVLGFRLSRIIAVGDASLLAQTEVTQPALLAASLAAWRALRAELPRLVPASAAGLSLGEYSALASAGALDLADAFRLVSARGRLTDSAARRRPGSMSAILGLTRDKVESICASLCASDQARELGHVQIANYNAPTQFVVTGDNAAVREVSSQVVAAGGRAVALKISGAFHSPHMAEARRRLTPLLESTNWKTPAFPVFANATARPHQDAAAIARELGAQVTSPVFWEDVIREMWARGVRIFVELGPGKTLAGLIARIIPEATTLGVSDLATLSQAVAVLDAYALEAVS